MKDEISGPSLSSILASQKELQDARSSCIAATEGVINLVQSRTYKNEETAFEMSRFCVPSKSYRHCIGIAALTVHVFLSIT